MKMILVDIINCKFKFLLLVRGTARVLDSASMSLIRSLSQLPHRWSLSSEFGPKSGRLSDAKWVQVYCEVRAARFLGSQPWSCHLKYVMIVPCLKAPAF